MGMSQINWDSLYSAGTVDYRNPSEPDPGDTVTLRFRTKKQDVDSVELYLEKDRSTVEMVRVSSDAWFDYYQTKIVAGVDKICYAFLIHKGEETLRFNRLGVSDVAGEAFDFTILPGFHVPSWLKGAVMYQIFVDRFYDGDPTNNVVNDEYIYLGHAAESEPWDAPIAPLDVYRFYGGDLAGVMKKLDYIANLGVEVIYFNPLFVSPSNHKYDIQDYEHIDPHYGRIVRDGGSRVEPWEDDNARATKYSIRTASRENLTASDQLFVELVGACHKRGIRVIIDGVFNHCGSFNKWMNKSSFYNYKDQSNAYAAGAYQLKSSPYHDYFAFSDDSDAAWPNNNTYEKWWGNDTLPKLNYEGSTALEDAILKIGRKWVSSPFNVDGWRLDVAADLGHSAEYNHSFWQRFRTEVKSANPDAVILAEHYGDPASWLQGNEWDTIMNYDAFMEPVTWFLTGMEKHSDADNPGLFGDGGAFFGSMKYHMARMPESSVLSSMNELSNHDHSRFLTRTNRTVGRIGTMGSKAADEGVSIPLFRLGAMMLMTWPGAPTIYYGDEIGMTGWTEPDSRRPFPWGHENLELQEYHRYLISIHKHFLPMREGALIQLACGRDYIVYGRMLGQKVAVIVIHTGDLKLTLDIPMWIVGITDDIEINRVMLTNAHGYNVGKTTRHTTNGLLTCHLDPFAGKIYVADLSGKPPVV